jgi:hypothetical protein
MRIRLLALLLFLAVTACTERQEVDQLGAARKRLHSAPCGAATAVAGAAGVNGDPRQVYLGDWVVVSVCHLDALVHQAEAQQQTITLFIEGLDTGVEPSGIDIESGTVTFELTRNAANKHIWRQFLYDPLFDPEATMRISVGIHGDRPLPRATGANLSLRLKKLYVDSWTMTWLALLIAVAIAIVIYARRSDMLRDAAPVDGVRQPYSLARAQMAWWFFLLVVGYVFIWLVTGEADSISPSLLGLLGISAATALAAVAIPSSRGLRATEGFARDLVSDDRGVVALDRLQVVVWTLVLGGIFLTSVLWDLTMPEFSATMLALMGISSGTYIGFKLPMKSTDKTSEAVALEPFDAKARRFAGGDDAAARVKPDVASMTHAPQFSQRDAQGRVQRKGRDERAAVERTKVAQNGGRIGDVVEESVRDDHVERLAVAEREHIRDDEVAAVVHSCLDGQPARFFDHRRRDRSRRRARVCRRRLAQLRASRQIARRCSRA